MLHFCYHLFNGSFNNLTRLFDNREFEVLTAVGQLNSDSLVQVLFDSN